MAPQIVVMTGCSSGIGLSLVQRLARDPDGRFLVIATVIAMSEKDDLEAAVKDYIGIRVFIKELDITNDDDITEIVGDVITKHGRIDVLLNMAGLAAAGIPERFSREQICKIFKVNVIGTLRLTQAVLPNMKERRSGKIITFSSVAGKIGFGYSELYCATKFAIEGFFESLAAGVRAFNIKVCLIEPRQVDSALWDGLIAQVKSLVDDDSACEIDRHQLRNKLSRMKLSNRLTIDYVVDVVTKRCLEVDEPVLRHLIDGEVDDSMREALRDLTGETGAKAFGLAEIADIADIVQSAMSKKWVP